MKKNKINIYALLRKVRAESPVIHHLTNWVTIYDCANIVKVLGASPVMAHAQEEAAEMASIASALVLNIGTLTLEFIQAMKIAAKSANQKGIPVILDVCGAGATPLRDRACFELLDEVKISIIKGNASEIARIAGENVCTKGVDSGKVNKDMVKVAQELAVRRQATVVITGKEDIVTNGKKLYLVANGDPMLAGIVGSGCISTSVVATFAAVESDFTSAAAAALAYFGIAAECAAKKARGPGSFKERLFDAIYSLDQRTIERTQKIKG